MTTALLLSGGMDSTAIAWWRRPEFGIFIDYGQRPAQAERRAAEAVAAAVGLELITLAVDCSSLGSGLLAGDDAPNLAGAPTPEWWPYRNQLLVTLAASAAIRRGVDELMIGTIADDHVNGDGTTAFIEALGRTLMIQEGGMRLSAPAIGFTASALVETSGVPQEVLAWSHSCFVGNIPCLACRGCQKHIRVLEETGRRWPEAMAGDPT